MATAADLIIRISGDLKDFEKKFGQLGRDLDQMGKKMTQTGKDLTKSVTLPIVAIGTAAVKTVADFDDSMSKVAAISGATGQELDDLRGLAKQLGADTAFSASQAADAMGFLATAGWDANQILSGTPHMLSLASAGGLELAESASIVADTMSQFQLSAEEAGRATDVFAIASSNSNTDVRQLGEAMKYAGATANAAGMDIEQTAAVLGIFANAGVKGSMAGTTFNSIMTDLRTAAAEGKNSLNDMTFAIYDSDGAMRDMGAIMADIERATAGMTTEQRDMELAAIFGQRAMRGLNTLLAAGSEAYDELADSIYASEGAAKRMADIMENNMGGSFRQLKSQMEGVLIQLGEVLVPMVQKVVGTVGEWLKAFMALDDSTKQHIVNIALMAAAIGPVVAIIGKLTSGFGAAATAIKGALSVLSGGGGLTAALGSLIGPAGIAVLAVAAIAALGYAIYQVGKDSRDASKEVTRFIGTIEDSAAAYDKQLDGIKSSTEGSKKLADEIFKLEKITDKDNAQKLRMRDLVAQLNGEMPGLNLAINEQTGNLNKSEQAVYGYIGAIKEQMKFEAQKTRLLELYKEQADLAEEARKSQERLTKAQEANGDTTVNLSNQWGQMRATLSKTQTELVYATTSHEDLRNAQSKNADQIKALEAELDGMYQTIVDSGPDAREEVKAMSADLEETLYEMEMDQEEYYKRMREAKDRHISDMGGLDKKGIEMTKLTAKEIKANLEQQIKDFQNWRENIKALSSRVPKDVLDELYKLGPSFTPVIKDLNKMTDKELADWVAVWQGKSKEAADAAKAEVDGLPGYMRSKGRAAGDSLGDGLLAAIKGIKGAAKKAATAASLGPVTYTSSGQKVATQVTMAAYEKGTSYVPQDGPAYLHRGERVLTAAENRAFSKGMGLTININGPISSERDADFYGQAIVKQLRLHGVLT